MNSQDVYLHLCSIPQALQEEKTERQRKDGGKKKKPPFNTLTPNHVRATSSEGRQTDFGAKISVKGAN